jgi:hypothetical protein
MNISKYLSTIVCTGIISACTPENPSIYENEKIAREAGYTDVYVVSAGVSRKCTNLLQLSTYDNIQPKIYDIEESFVSEKYTFQNILPHNPHTGDVLIATEE